jgi:hypothetical protein
MVGGFLALQLLLLMLGVLKHSPTVQLIPLIGSKAFVAEILAGELLIENNKLKY